MMGFSIAYSAEIAPLGCTKGGTPIADRSLSVPYQPKRRSGGTRKATRRRIPRTSGNFPAGRHNPGARLRLVSSFAQKQAQSCARRVPVQIYLPRMGLSSKGLTHTSNCAKASVNPPNLHFLCTQRDRLLKYKTLLIK